MNEIREQIAKLRGPSVLTCPKQDALGAGKTMEKLLVALEKIITHGVWDECIHCNAKVKIAELATVQTRQSDDD